MELMKMYNSLPVFAQNFACTVQAWVFQKNLVKRELAAASYLLEEDVPPAVVALAWNQTEVTGEGEKLMRAIGHVEGTQSCLLLTAQILVPLFLL